MQSVLQSDTAMETVISKYVAEDSIKHGTIIVSIVPIIAVYPFLQKYFVKGVMDRLGQGLDDAPNGGNGAKP